MFKYPDGIGIDEDGYLYVLDTGNRYIRMIDPTGYVSTLINGACFDYKLNTGKNEALICLRKWIKTSGEPSEHIVSQNVEFSCTDNTIECGRISPLIRRN